VVVPVAIPAPGASNTVSIAVPAGSDYSIEIVAFHELHDGIRVALAGGEVRNLTFNPGNNTASVTVAPWTYTVSGPDTIHSGARARDVYVEGDGRTDRSLYRAGGSSFQFGAKQSGPALQRDRRWHDGGSDVQCPGPGHALRIPAVFRSILLMIFADVRARRWKP
jgi:hypothetical protein